MKMTTEVEVEDFAGSDEDIDEKKHQRLLDKVLSLNKAQQLKKASRTEPSLKISEFDLVKSGTGQKGTVYIDDLTKVLEKRKTHVKIKKKVDVANKISRTLPKPLEKPTADRIRRTVAYEKTRLELDRWEAIVTSNRVSQDLSFPLQTSKRVDKEELTSRWRLKTLYDLEIEKNNPAQVEEIHVDIEKEKFPMTMNEIIEHRKEAAKLRAHQSYKEAKARRQNKIKSKKYHRLQRREKIKQQLKAFELLQKTDPEEALKKLEEIERIRAQERFSLRHKSTGKWAQNKQIRAKYDKESRQELAEQLKLSKQLTQKINVESDSDNDNPQEEVAAKINATEKNNPWLNNFKVDKEVTDFVDSYKKYWSQTSDKHVETIDKSSEQNNESVTKDSQTNTKKNEHIETKSNSEKDRKKKSFCERTALSEKKIKQQKKSKRKSLSTSEWDVEMVHGENIDAVFDKLEKKLGSKLQKKLKSIQGDFQSKRSKKIKRKSEKNQNETNSLLTLPILKKRPKIDEPLVENVNGEDDPTDTNLNVLKNILEKKDGPVKKKKPNETNIDPNKFMKVKTIQLDTELPDILTTGDNYEEMEEDSSQRQLMVEAFQDDDLLEEFSKEKSTEIEKNKPKDIDLTLPGWGNWGGTGIVPSKRKKKRFILRAPKKMPRRDDNKGFLIINEDGSNKIKEHLVDELPFPFQRVKDFEASIRAPIGRSFVPETVFRRLTKPALQTRIGTIIEPMEKDVLLKKSSG